MSDCTLKTYNQYKNMRTVLTILVFILSATAVSAQKETFDLITYTAPGSWTKETGESAVSYFSINKKNKSWCRISVYKSTVSKGSIESDFQSEWNILVAKEYNVTEPPQASEEVDTEGWKVKTGAGKFIFDKANATALITTFSGFERCMSIVAVTNDQEYLASFQHFLETIVMKLPDITTAQPVATQPTTIYDSASVIGCVATGSGVKLLPITTATTWIMASTATLAVNTHLIRTAHTVSSAGYFPTSPILFWQKKMALTN